jgi:endonuclease YncB( thermonuclease family)
VTKVLNGTKVEFKDAINKNSINQIVHLFGIYGPSPNSTFQNNSKIHLSRLLGRGKLLLIIKKVRDTHGGLVGTFYKIRYTKKNINKQMALDGYAWCFKRLICPEAYYNATRKAILSLKGFWRTLTIKPKRNRKDKKENCSNDLKGEHQVSVVKVIDGDTITVQKINSPDRSILKVRMSGIDAPETKQFFGMKSKMYLQQLIDSFNTKAFQLSLACKDIYTRH